MSQASNQLAADVKCYHCGHVIGQRQRLTPSSFVPRPGYTGSKPAPGARLRCERCSGPVFLEDVSNQGFSLPARTVRLSANNASEDEPRVA